MEYWDAYDVHGRPLNHTLLRGEPVPPGEYHIVIHAWIVSSKGEVLLQRRAFDRAFAPGMWFAIGGSALIGETDDMACAREIREEMGFEADMDAAIRVITYVRGDALVTVYLIFQDVALSQMTLQTEEVADARWVPFKEFVEGLKSDRETYRTSYSDLLIRCIKEIREWRDQK